MATISEAFAIALQHHQAGRLELAEQIYRQILAVEPDHADSLQLLGLIAYQVGQYPTALELIGRAVALNPTADVYHNNLGLTYRGLGRNDEAVASFRRAVQLNSRMAGTHNNLGNALRDQGNLDEAIASFRQALQLDPRVVEAHNNLGNALRDRGELDEAVACYRRALELNANYVDAYNNLGNVLHEQGKLPEAIACYRRALELVPDHAQALDNLGTTLVDQQKTDEAIACYRRALELQPDYAIAHNNLGVAFKVQGKLEAAAACCRRALELNPDYAEAHNNLGNALKDQGNLDEAVPWFCRALELKPDFAEAHSNLGNTFKDQGRVDEAIACYRRALALKPGLVKAHNSLVATLHYRHGVTLAELAQAHAEFDRQYAQPLRTDGRPHTNPRDPDRRLRLGIVSPNFGHHPVGHFLIRALERLDRQAAEVTCYCDRTIDDDLTTRFRATAAAWRDVFGWTDEQLAEQIRADQVDILFDLAGHTSDNRLLVFARKPAPIQITWIGYEGTTGLSAMDCLLADRYIAPEGSELHYRERVLRMPDGYVCYDPPEQASPVGPLPALAQGHVTFGSFNNPAKITPEVVKVWAEILCRLPRARLVLKYWALGNASVVHRYRELFANRGVEPGRLTLLPPSSFADYLTAYGQIDIALDPFPFSGSATTCEALWMGLPVITCPGETFASRHGLTHLSNIGLTEMIARSPEDYVELAVRLAGDLAGLSRIRAGLRRQVAESPLCDGKRFADNLLCLLRDVWRDWCKSAR